MELVITESNPKIGVVGLSHLGLVTSLSFAAKKIRVTGFDLSPLVVAEFNSGSFTVEEPGLHEVLYEFREYIDFSSDLESLNECDLIYIAKDIPTDDQGFSNLKPIHELIEVASKYFSKDSIIIILCQVAPGFTRELSKELEQSLYYQVETLIFGDAINRALRPERYIVGKVDNLHELSPTYLRVLETFGCPIIQTTFESAELAKLAINLYLASSITTTNSLAEICESIGADWNQIVPALRLDERIGSKSYVQPGLGISGGNIERDIASIINLGLHYKTDVGIFQSFIHNSNHRKNWPVKKIDEIETDGIKLHKIAIWGFAYKKDTHSIKNSPAIKIIHDLKDKYEIVATDPIAELPQNLSVSVKFETEPLEAVSGADCLLILTDWSIYSKIDLDELFDKIGKKIIIDPYGVLNDKAQKMSLRYFRLGY